MTFFLDASVLIATEDGEDPQHLAARRVLYGPRAVATSDLARYETANVAVRSWRDPASVRRLGMKIDGIGRDGEIHAVTSNLIDSAVAIADRYGISVYDASYVAAAETVGAQLVSCDVRDLVSKGLAILPSDALALGEAD